MSINFYFKHQSCVSCGHGKEDLHIGKSSGGYAFGLHIYPSLNICTLEDWLMYMRIFPGKIFDGYGFERSLEELIDTITRRPLEWQHRPEEYLRVVNGPGTYDYLDFDFC